MNEKKKGKNARGASQDVAGPSSGDAQPMHAQPAPPLLLQPSQVMQQHQADSPSGQQHPTASKTPRKKKGKNPSEVASQDVAGPSSGDAQPMHAQPAPPLLLQPSQVMQQHQADPQSGQPQHSTASKTPRKKKGKNPSGASQDVAEPSSGDVHPVQQSPVQLQQQAGPQSGQQQHPLAPQAVQQQRPFAPQTGQQQRPPVPRAVQQQRPPAPQAVQQQRPIATQAGQQQRPMAPQTGQQHRLPAPQAVQQQRPPAPQAVQQQRPPAPQAVQQQRPPAPQAVQQQRPPAPQAVQQQRPMAPQAGQQQRPMAPQAGQQRPAAPRAGPQQRPQAPPVDQQRATAPSAIPRPHAQGGSLRPPSRQVAGGQGTIGRPIQLSANHFAITLKNTVVYHYDVDIRPEPPKTLFRKVMLQFLNSDPRFKGTFPVFDLKKNIYTPRRIPGLNSLTEIKYCFQEPDRETPRANEYTICLQPTGEVEIDLSALQSYCQGHGSSVDIPLRPIQALDIALKYGATQRNTKVMLGSCLLNKPMGRAEELGGGVEVWFGHFQSLRLGWQPFLNVDATQRAFLKSGKVHMIMADMYRTRPGEALYDRDYMDFSKKIATLKVTYSRGNYVANVGCNGIKGPANQERFECDGRTVTVQQYFEDKLRIKLQFPHLPCVWVGSREKKNLVPMELCTIAEGQEYRRKLTDFQTSAMIKVAATPADVRKKKILDAVRDMQFGSDAYSQNFGISVDSQMAKIKGRVLPAPKLAYGDKESSSIVPRDGVWNMTNTKFVEAKSMNHYGFINITRCSEQEIMTFVGALKRAGQEMGMVMGQPLFIRHIGPRDLESTMIQAKQKFPELQIIFVIINRKGDPAYEIVKRVGDLNLRITTQCIQQKNVTGRGGPDRSTMANICLKLNAKLGGVNNLIARDFRPKVLLNEQVIIMGADVTHPGADQQDSGKPSIAAVVGSVDPRASQYCCEIRIQKSKQEYIEDMEGMVYNLLRKFNRVSGSTSTGKPQRIIFYRDGVSEGQFAKVLEWELSAIRKACMRLENGYNPPVTFVVVQKRHHTRLFPEDPRDESGRGRNVPPGTIVDSTIVHPVEQDFFLVSHQGIQGTSRPTHYHVLWDDSKMQANDLQMLTYYMCYLFTRCTRSVSYPAPCYYSHLVAFRGRQYYDNLVASSRSASSRELQQHIDSTRDLSFMFFV